MRLHLQKRLKQSIHKTQQVLLDISGHIIIVITITSYQYWSNISGFLGLARMSGVTTNSMIVYIANIYWPLLLSKERPRVFVFLGKVTPAEMEPAHPEAMLRKATRIQPTQAVTHSCGRVTPVLAGVAHGMQGRGPSCSGRAVLSHHSV